MTTFYIHALQEAVRSGAMDSTFLKQFRYEVDASIRELLESALDAMRKVFMKIRTDSFEAVMGVLLGKDLNLPFELKLQDLDGDSRRKYNFGEGKNKIRFVTEIANDFTVRILYDYIIVPTE